MSAKHALITIDGSHGEGGGQILRTSLALAMCTGRGVLLERIRAGRAKPGLMRQHLTAVKAAARVCAAEVAGAELHSRELKFLPGKVQPGEYRFAIGTAGSTTLVLQTVLPPLLTAHGPSRLVLEGGTHNPFAPPYDFLARAFLPLVCRLGPRVSLNLTRPGFVPNGGGEMIAEIEPASRLQPLHLPERGEVRRQIARALVARLSTEIAERELRTVQDELGWPPDALQVIELPPEYGPGNALLLEIESEHVTEVFCGFGSKGVPAEHIARTASAEARRYLEAGVPVGEHLADQLLVPLALAGGGSFVTLPLSSHATTNIDIIRQFLDVRVTVEKLDPERSRVTIER